MYWINLLVMKYKCPIPAAWNFVELMYAVETFGLLNCTCSYGITLCKCSVTPSMSLSWGFGLAKFLSQLHSDGAANWNSRAVTQTSHRLSNLPDMVNVLTTSHTRHSNNTHVTRFRLPQGYIEDRWQIRAIYDVGPTGNGDTSFELPKYWYTKQEYQLWRIAMTSEQVNKGKGIFHARGDAL